MPRRKMAKTLHTFVENAHNNSVGGIESQVRVQSGSGKLSRLVRRKRV